MQALKDRAKNTLDHQRQEELDRIREIEAGDPREEARRKMAQDYYNTARAFGEMQGYKKDLEKAEREREKEEYRRMCDENNRKRAEKEAALRKYYQALNEDQNERVQAHLRNVYGPNMQLEMAEMQRQRKDEAAAARQAAEREAHDNENRNRVNQDFVKDNEEIKRFKDARRAEAAHEAQDAAQRLKNEHDAMERERQRERAELDEQKRLYGQTLLYQKAMQDQMNHNYGKMTMQEKKMNKNDLRAFRNYDNAMYSMVPGINNFSTVGAAA